MATYNSSHGAGPGHAHTHTGASHGLPLPIVHGMPNSGVAMDVFDQDLNFDETLL